MSDHQTRPAWVAIGLWKVRSRGAAWLYFCISIALAVGGIAYGFKDERFFGFAIFFGAALWYALAIRWMDRCEAWE